MLGHLQKLVKYEFMAAAELEACRVLEEGLTGMHLLRTFLAIGFNRSRGCGPRCGCTQG
jgi:hypothetical protein